MLNKPDRASGNVTVVHEAYSFACLQCSDSWGETFVIWHVVEVGGRVKAVYVADERPIESPLRHLTCPACDRGKVQILRSGCVADANHPPQGPAS